MDHECGGQRSRATVLIRFSKLGLQSDMFRDLDPLLLEPHIEDILSCKWLSSKERGLLVVADAGTISYIP
jgi:hypothetical protein